jgi:hypothetical protein
MGDDAHADGLPLVPDPTAPEVFRRAVDSLAGMRTRDEVQFEQIRAPKRLAPWALALSCEAVGPDDAFASGRFILLHDPESEESWGGQIRVVCYVTAEMDADLGADPLLPEVAWSWLTDALENCTAGTTTLGGTVTRTASVRFGEIDGPSRADDLELRASWTADDDRLAAHGEAFSELMGSTVGLPPVGVVALSQLSQRHGG